MTRKSVLLVLFILVAGATPASARQVSTPGNGEIILTAVDMSTGETLPGACYSIADQPFCDTDFDGVVWVTDVPPGAYVVTETLAPNGYQLVAPFSVSVDPAFPNQSIGPVPHIRLAGSDVSIPQDSAPQIGAPAALDVRFYESPNWGYIFSWDPNKWPVITESSEGGVDQLALSGPAGTVELMGGQAYGGDPASCLTAAEQNIWTVPSVVNVRMATDESGYGFDSSDDWRAGNIYQADFADGTAQLWQIDCYQLAAGSEVLRIERVASFEQYEQFWEDLDEIPLGLTFPRRSFTGIDETEGYLLGPANGCQATPYPPRLLHDSAGNEMGMVTWHKPADFRAQPSSLLLFENTGSASIAIDARQFRLVIREGSTEPEIGSAPVAQFEWLYATGNALDPVQSIGPGRRSILRLGFQLSFSPDQYPYFEIYYVAPDGTNIPVAALDSTGCGAGGGRGKPARSG